MIRIIPYRKVSELDVLLQEYLHENARFIVPSRRDRDWWRTRLGVREFGLDAERLGNLWNWEDLYNDLCEFLDRPRLRQIDPPDHRLILSHIVEAFLKEESVLLKEWPGLARPGFIDILSDDIRELINEGVSVEQLEFASGANSSAGILPRLYRRYLGYLSANRLMDSAQIPQRAEELFGIAGETWGESLTCVFVGFMSFTHSQLKLVRAIEEACPETVVFKPEAELQGFQDATGQFEFGKTWEDPAPPSAGRIVSLGVADFALEPEAVARELALWQAGKGFLSTLPDNPFPGFGNIGMTIPPQREAAMEAALRRYRIPCFPARGRSIGRTPLGAALFSAWSAWIQGMDTAETALLLTQPCLAGEAPFSVDEAVMAGPRGVKGWESYLEHRERSVTDREAKKHARHTLRAFRATVRFCRALDKGAPPEGIFAALYAFLTTSGLWLDALASMPLTSPDLDESLRELASSIAEVDAKRLALRELQPDLGVAGDIALKGKEAVDFLRSWCEDTLVRPAPPVTGAVMIHTGPPPILASWPVWIMLDATQKSWPGVQRSSPLLGAEARERMRDASAWLPSAHDKRMQKEALFRRLMQTGESLTVVSYSVTDEEGRPAGGTSLLKPFLEDMKLWELIKAPVVELENLLPAEGGVCFPLIETPLAEKAGRGMPVLYSGGSSDGGKLPRLPVSDLYELLDCPFRWWLRRNAGLQERPSGLLNSAEAGQLTHKIWENVWKRRMEEELPLTALAAEEWGNALTKKEGYQDFEHLLNDRRLARHLKNLEFYVFRLAAFQQEIADRLSLSGFEYSKLYTEELELSLEIEGVSFTGRCDRAEVLNERYAVILDYKLGKSTSYERKFPNLSLRRHLPPELVQDRETFRYGLQLSAYALMYETRFPEHKIAGVGFLGHKDGGLAGTFESPLAACYLPDQKPASPEERIAEAETAMRCAAFILKSGRYEPCYLAESCRYCDMKGICRKGELRGEVLLDVEDDFCAEGDENEMENYYERPTD